MICVVVQTDGVILVIPISTGQQKINTSAQSREELNTSFTTLPISRRAHTREGVIASSYREASKPKILNLFILFANLQREQVPNPRCNIPVHRRNSIHEALTGPSSRLATKQDLLWVLYLERSTSR
jgi:hypothetical protein